MTCPICGAETVVTYRPFCSKRCSDLDLARWLNGSYAIPSAVDEDQTAEDDDDRAPGRRH